MEVILGHQKRQSTEPGLYCVALETAPEKVMQTWTSEPKVYILHERYVGIISCPPLFCPNPQIHSGLVLDEDAYK